MNDTLQLTGRHTGQIPRLTVALIRALGNTLAAGPAADRLCIVNYHRVLPVHNPLLASEPDVAAFSWQMELLARCFHVMPLRKAMAHLQSGEPIPPRSVCITFDDGYRSIHDLALPVLRRFGLPATVFVTSGHVGKGNMWNDRIIEAVQMLPDGLLDLSDLGLGTFSLHSLDDRMAAIGLLTERSKYLPPAERSNVIERLVTLAGATMTPELMLTQDMVRNLDRSGIEIGAHTVTHPILTSLDDASARAEISTGKEELEAILGKPVRLFAYPNGKVGMDFDHRHVAMVREAGFDAAFTTAVGAITRDQDHFQLPRSRPWDSSPLMFGLRLLRWLVQGRPQ
ncbi:MULTISPECIES: polysaccharide deacetylase family protein [unclassified Massilia]|uniref:polysaccharide deacetylase family protein n=1 Tax=unclassified Massilia TaxID=2609279 RepID=UPI0017808441|nr:MULTISPECIES: polysaccharide deacetylase family protein [unclassified Massilia]MBD8531332.1 polysaccharide deacetylase family protein [Massilia sp. CFBP 13647]MBD8674413.1 polysaccharide deacetylase family protein [Massilia sp. CFBP 13721]